MLRLTLLSSLLVAWCVDRSDDADDDFVKEHIRRALSSYADGGSDLACWKDRVLTVCETNFPGIGLDMGPTWNKSGVTLVEGTTFTATAALINFEALNLTIKHHGYPIDHANFHACKRSTGFCTPFVAATPGLVTHAPATKSHTGAEEFSINLDVGRWTLIMVRRALILHPCTWHWHRRRTRST
jgi:hypothetical protein